MERITHLEQQVLMYSSKVGAAMEMGMDALIRTKEARAIAVPSMRQSCKVCIGMLAMLEVHAIFSIRDTSKEQDTRTLGH